MILLIDNYDSFTYNLYQYVCQLGVEVRVERNDALDLNEIQALAPDGIIISPGPGRPEDAGICQDLIKSFSGKIPIFGVCLGHQAIAQTFGGDVILAPDVAHGIDGAVTHQSEGLFEGLTSPLMAGRYHSLTVSAENFPETLQIDAGLEDGTVMALSHKDHPTFGVQFHPESVLTPDGMGLLENFLKVCQDADFRNS